MMNDPKWLRCPTLLAEASRAGLTVAVVTAKDKLRTLLGHGLQGICFSAECADAATLATHGIGDVLALVGKPLPAEVSAQALCAALNKAPGIDSALTRAQAAHTLQLPADRIGDVVVLADRFTVLGTTPSAHDLSGLDAPLRSHGGRGEQSVPLIVNRPAPLLDRQRRWRNFDVFDVALNYVQ
jgi:hypothetical protein